MLLLNQMITISAYNIRTCKLSHNR